MHFPKKLFQLTVCLLVIAVMFVTVPFTADAEDNENVPTLIDENQVLYLKPNENWVADDAWFALYYFDFNDHYDCVPMTDADGDGIYEAVLPEGYCNFLFYRMDSAVTDFDGEYVLHQTDVFEYAENTQCYTLAEDSWETGNWETAPVIADVAADSTEDSETDTPTDIAETVSGESAVETDPADSAEQTVSKEQNDIEEPVSEEKGIDILTDTTEETAPQIEKNIFYLSLDQVDQEFTWKIQTQTADYVVTEETEDIFSVELPVDTETIILCGESTDQQIASVEISLDDIQDNNCIVALACEDDVDMFEIMWGIYDPETEEVTFAFEENLASIEEIEEETVATEATVDVNVEDSENTDAVS